MGSSGRTRQGADSGQRTAADTSRAGHRLDAAGFYYKNGSLCQRRAPALRRRVPGSSNNSAAARRRRRRRATKARPPSVTSRHTRTHRLMTSRVVHTHHTASNTNPIQTASPPAANARRPLPSKKSRHKTATTDYSRQLCIFMHRVSRENKGNWRLAVPRPLLLTR